MSSAFQIQVILTDIMHDEYERYSIFFKFILLIIKMVFDYVVLFRYYFS